jgi:hypothetical protein
MRAVTRHIKEIQVKLFLGTHFRSKVSCEEIVLKFCETDDKWKYKKVKKQEAPKGL